MNAKRSKVILFPLSAALTLGLFTSCSSSETQDPNLMDSTPVANTSTTDTGDPVASNPIATPPANSKAVQGGQGTQSTQEQRRNFLIAESLKRARRARDLKMWDDVVTAATSVLELDSNNEEARKLLNEAQEVLGDRIHSIGAEAERARIQAEIERQRDRQRAADFETKGDAEMSNSEFEAAGKSYERALLTIRYSPWFTPTSEIAKRLEAKIKRAAAELDKAKKSMEEDEARKARMKLAEKEAEALSRKKELVRSLFEKANLAFQSRQYGDSVRYLDEALRLDPLNRDATDLRELALRARHDLNMDLIQLRWKSEWAQTFRDLRTLDVPQTETVEYDLRHWAKIRNRGPIEFSDVKAEHEDADTAAILRKLDSTVVDNKFDEAPLEDWVEFYRRATGINILVSPKVNDLDDEQKTLTKFNVGRMSVRKALDLIASIRPIKWQVRDGVLHLMTAEESQGELIPRAYDVREIINPIAQHPGMELQQKVGEGFGNELEEEEPVPIVVEMEKLQELIRNNIKPESWEREGVEIITSGSAFVVIQTEEVHKAINQLLNDLRSSTGIQVDIESRFLEVEDNFLEEIGVDFRGLGDQSSSGVPGRGLEKQGDRSGFGFDDFGQNVSPSEPSAIGSGFEPGIFYDNGGDGDLFGRTELLFDRAIGGSSGGDGLTNAGGLSFQYTYLDDTEFEIILRAVQKQERVQQLSAPRLLVHNTARANLSVTKQFTYIRDFNVEIAQAAAVADPVVDVIRDGIVLDVRPVVSADMRYILMEMRPTLATLTLPIPTFTTTLGVGQQISIQLPELQLQKVRTTITVPDGGILLLGGMKEMQKQDFTSGVPILKDIPVVGFFFRRRGHYNANRKVLILLRARVYVPSEHEPKFNDMMDGTR